MQNPIVHAAVKYLYIKQHLKNFIFPSPPPPNQKKKKVMWIIFLSLQKTISESDIDNL